jgi:hypothetical protein
MVRLKIVIYGPGLGEGHPGSSFARGTCGEEGEERQDRRGAHPAGTSALGPVPAPLNVGQHAHLQPLLSRGRLSAPPGTTTGRTWPRLLSSDTV